MDIPCKYSLVAGTRLDVHRYANCALARLVRGGDGSTHGAPHNLPRCRVDRSLDGWRAGGGGNCGTPSHRPGADRYAYLYWRLAGAFIPVAKYAIRWWYPLTDAELDDPVVQERVRRHTPVVDMSDPSVRRAILQNARIPMSAVDHFFRITRYARKLLRRVETPTLVLHGRRDTVAVPICAEEVYRALASSDKELTWIDDGGHQLIIGEHGREAIDRVVDWLERHVHVRDTSQ